jgi:anti-sigma regulatory factor (Ser/Thr protein kinase)
MNDGQLHLRILSDPANVAGIRLAIEKMCADGGFDAKALEEVGLCVNEALANVIRHAYHEAFDKPIEIDARMESGAIHIAIRDWGNGAVPNVAEAKKLDPLKPGGLGLICLKKMMDQVVFVPQPDGMLLEMTRMSTSDARHQNQ